MRFTAFYRHAHTRQASSRILLLFQPSPASFPVFSPWKRCASHVSTIVAATNSPSSFSSLPPASPPPPPEWTLLLERLHNQGHFHADPHILLSDLSPSSTAAPPDPAAIKRAILSFSRSRPDLLTALSSSTIAILVTKSAHAIEAESDRKTRNAHRRLDASFLKKASLDIGAGGAADFQDVLRLVMTLVMTCDLNNSKTTEAAVLTVAEEEIKEILDNVLAAMDAIPPTGGAPSQSHEQLSTIASPKAANIAGLASKTKTNSSRKKRSDNSKNSTPWYDSKF